MSEYTFRDQTPSLDDYLRLRVITGLTPKATQAAAAGLPNTFFGVTVFCGEEVVGMGRIIGDGGLFFQIVDIAVDPAHQDQGIGKAIVSRLVDHLRSHAPSSAYVSLIADGEAHRLYAQFGFEPTAPRSIGMAFVI